MLLALALAAALPWGVRYWGEAQRSRYVGALKELAWACRFYQEREGEWPPNLAALSDRDLAAWHRPLPRLSGGARVVYRRPDRPLDAMEHAGEVGMIALIEPDGEVHLAYVDGHVGCHNSYEALRPLVGEAAARANADRGP